VIARMMQAIANCRMVVASGTKNIVALGHAKALIITIAPVENQSFGKGQHIHHQPVIIGLLPSPHGDFHGSNDRQAGKAR
jgi:hypothetical protein